MYLWHKKKLHKLIFKKTLKKALIYDIINLIKLVLHIKCVHVLNTISHTLKMKLTLQVVACRKSCVLMVLFTVFHTINTVVFVFFTILGIKWNTEYELLLSREWWDFLPPWRLRKNHSRWTDHHKVSITFSFYMIKWTLRKALEVNISLVRRQTYLRHP